MRAYTAHTQAVRGNVQRELCSVNALVPDLFAQLRDALVEGGRVNVRGARKLLPLVVTHDAALAARIDRARTRTHVKAYAVKAFIKLSSCGREIRSQVGPFRRF